MCNSVKVDQKGRLKIPMTLLAALQEFGADFYITSENGDSVRIYPMNVWNEVEGQLERLSLHNHNNQRLLARVKYFGQAVTIDKQGRVLIPIVLRDCAQIKGAVDILHYASYLEIWNHARLMNNLKTNPITAQTETTLNDLIATRHPLWTVHRKHRERRVAGRARRFVLHRQLRDKSRSRLNRPDRRARTNPPKRARAA